MADSKIYEGNGHHVMITDPENITPDECLGLARCDAEAWNEWRTDFPVLILLFHKGLSLLALFLIGLALRNLFKMK